MNYKLNKKSRTITFTNIMNESQLDSVVSAAEEAGTPYVTSDYSTKVVVSAHPTLKADADKDAQLNKFIEIYNR